MSTLFILLALASGGAHADPTTWRRFDCFAPISLAGLESVLVPEEIPLLRGWNQVPKSSLRVVVRNPGEASLELQGLARSHRVRMTGLSLASRRELRVLDAHVFTPDLEEEFEAAALSRALSARSVYAMLSDHMSNEMLNALLGLEAANYDGHQLVAWNQVRESIPESHPFASVVRTRFIMAELEHALVLFSEKMDRVSVCLDDEPGRVRARAERDLRRFLSAPATRAWIGCAGQL